MSHSFSYWICLSLAGMLCYLLVQTQERCGASSLCSWRGCHGTRAPPFGPEPEPEGSTPPPRRKTPSLAEATPVGWRQPCAPVETGISGASVKCRWSWASKVVQRRTNTAATFHTLSLSSSCPLSGWIKPCLHSSFSSKEKLCPLPWVLLFSFTHRFSSQN